MSENLKQLNVRLPEVLHRELKAECALNDASVATVIEQLVRLYLSGKVKLPAKERPRT